MSTPRPQVKGDLPATVPTEPSTAGPALALLLVSALGLYLELVLIRWLASEIRVFAYFKNFPLFAAFIGLGLGCYVADKRPIRWWRSGLLLSLISLAAVFSERLHLTRLFFPDPALYTWGGSILSPNLVEQARLHPFVAWLVGSLPPGPTMLVVGAMSLLAIAVLFAVTAGVFYPIGQETGRLFQPHPPLVAYSINVAGALLGSTLFTGASWLELGPAAWLVPPFAAIGWFARRSGARHGLAYSGLVAAAVVVAVLSAGAPGETIAWSPYYRISLTPGIPEDRNQGWTLRVNHDYFQRAADLSPGAVSRRPNELAGIARDYELPYRLLGRLDRVLVVGAGMGNDVAAALRAGARSVDAVEIDPLILRLGAARHPERPYAAGAVRTIVGDARTFFKRQAARPDRARYDLVVFGLLDSQTALSAMSSVRLEFYVYTEESFREALSLADPEHGLVVISFSVGWRYWVGEKLYQTLVAAGQEPLALAVGGYDGGVTFVVGPGLRDLDRSRLAPVGATDVTADYRGGDASFVCRDDWPFLYANPHHWPWVYMAALGLLLLIGTTAVAGAMRRTAPIEAPGARRSAFDFHMFLMGAAFMLVETSALARLSLLFGATWLVNAGVISAVMVMILAANGLVSLKKAPSLVTGYVLLGLSLLVVYAVPFESFMAVTGGPVLALAIVALPVMFSGLVFATVFATVPNGHVALGSNLLGAILGGVLEAASLAVGIRALALVAILMYASSAAALWRRR